MKCRKCGSNNPDKADVCRKCGYRFGQEWQPSFKWSVRVLAVIYAALILFYLLLRYLI